MIARVTASASVVSGSVLISSVSVVEAVSFVAAGGSSANSSLRSKLTELLSKKHPNVDLILPRLSLCGDNAAMIGAAGYYAYLRGDIADFSLNPEPGLDLE